VARTYVLSSLALPSVEAKSRLPKVSCTTIQSVRWFLIDAVGGLVPEQRVGHLEHGLVGAACPSPKSTTPLPIRHDVAALGCSSATTSEQFFHPAVGRLVRWDSRTGLRTQRS
jgi:hypothetical protein